MKQTLIDLCERQIIPEAMIRLGMRRMIGQRLHNEEALFHEHGPNAFYETVKDGAVAVFTDMANDQHYEVPDAFFQLVLGPRLKYSSGFYQGAGATLADAEDTMLALTCQRAELADGQDILELGCGWGSLTLFMAELFPAARITSVSNSASQRAYIEGQARQRGLENITVITADVARLELDQTFDRVVSVEMFEHMRNYKALTQKVANWLKPEGKVFIHIFCHQQYGYLFEVQDANDWMAENFFTGGIMPSFDIFENTSDALQVETKWWVDGTHYQKTLEDWKVLLDQKEEQVIALFMDFYGENRSAAKRRAQKWRMFFMASAELFGFAHGAEWGVGHFVLKRAS